MNVREQFHAIMDGAPVDGMPVLEWEQIFTHRCNSIARDGRYCNILAHDLCTVG